MPVDLPPPSPPPAPPPREAVVEPDDVPAAPAAPAVAAAPPSADGGYVVARPVAAAEREVTYVPLAVTIGDGFKFGCGFFLALVLAMLVGFVLVAALFALMTVFGLNLPITR